MSKFTIQNEKGEFLEYNTRFNETLGKPYRWFIKEYATEITTDMMKTVIPVLVSHGENIQTFKYNQV